MSPFSGNSPVNARVRELLGSREGRQYLESNEWIHGMPILVTQPFQPLEEALALTARYDGSVLLAVLGKNDDALRMLHISRSCADLQPVEATPQEMVVWDLVEQATRSCLVTFRISHWSSSAVAHVLPPFSIQGCERRGFYRHELVSTRVAPCVN